jgi:hypothetical protein
VQLQPHGAVIRAVQSWLRHKLMVAKLELVARYSGLVMVAKLAAAWCVVVPPSLALDGERP